MYCTNTDEAATLPMLKELYIKPAVEAYIAGNPFPYNGLASYPYINDDDVAYIVYRHKDNMEVPELECVRTGFIYDVNEQIDDRISEIRENEK